MARLRILLVEDHETVREGLKMILGAQADLEVIAEASDGHEAVTLAQRLLPDIVIMDISLPRLNGLKATQKLKQCCPQIKIIALTRHAEESYLHQLLRVGAEGYVLKQSSPAELVRAIRSVAGGGKYLDPSSAQKVIGAYAKKANHRTRDSEILSDRESETLRLIAWGHSNKEIAAQLGLSVKTIEVHKANAMKKLGMHSRIDIVRYALLQGWLEET